MVVGLGVVVEQAAAELAHEGTERATVARPGTWCILRTSGMRTIALEESLRHAGIDAWTPSEIRKRIHKRGKPPIEHRIPIAPSFVFARAVHLRELAMLRLMPSSPHPAFSIFRHAGRIPLIGDMQITGLRDEQDRAAAVYALRCEEDAWRQRNRERIALLRTEQARRKALRSECRHFDHGARVVVAQMPALAGLTGVVTQSNGTSAVVTFGGMLVMTIEAWRLSPDDVIDIAA